MARYIARRIGYMVITMFLVSIIGFIIIELPPGSYLEVYIQRLQQQGGQISYDQAQALMERYGLNDPVFVKYFKWISKFIRGDFGESFEYNMPVSELIWGRLGFTLLISLFTILFSWVFAILIGVYSATHKNTYLDYSITTFQFISLSIPSFLLALVVMIFAQQSLGMNVGGLFSQPYQNAPWSVDRLIDLLKHLWIPIIVIGVSGTSWLSRVMRGNLLDVLNIQYVQTARAKGLSENKVIWKHAVRNALHPLIMVLGMQLPVVISGETVVSLVLNLPTTGPLFFKALMQQDMYLAGTFLIFLSFMLLVGNLLADLLLAWLDPRIRYQ